MEHLTAISELFFVIYLYLKRYDYLLKTLFRNIFTLIKLIFLKGYANYKDAVSYIPKSTKHDKFYVYLEYYMGKLAHFFFVLHFYVQVTDSFTTSLENKSVLMLFAFAIVLAPSLIFLRYSSGLLYKQKLKLNALKFQDLKTRFS